MIYTQELVVATILIQTGHDVEFLPVKRIRTADIRYLGLEWEIKSPRGKSSRTIENNIRTAIGQSCNIIIDLSRIPILEEKAISEVRKQVSKTKNIKKVLIITKNQEIVSIK